VCGIGGIVLLNPSAQLPSEWSVERAIDEISHRGPDYNGYVQLPQGGFIASTRLVIVDK